MPFGDFTVNRSWDCAFSTTLVTKISAVTISNAAIRGRVMLVPHLSDPMCAGRSLDQRDQRLSFFADVRGELGPVAGADVLRRVDDSGRHEQDIAGLDLRRLAVDLIFQRTFDHIDNLFTRMCVSGSDVPWIEIHAHLDDL